MALLALLAIVSAFNLEFDSSLRVWFLANDPTIVTYQQFCDQFGRDEVIVVGLEADHLFAAPTLNQIAECTRQLTALPLVDQAISITSVEVLTSSEEGALQRGTLLPADPREISDTELRERVMNHPIVGRLLLSEDGTATAIILTIAPECEDAELQIKLTHQVREIIAPLKTLGKTYLAGVPIVNDAMFRFARRDLLVLSPMVFILVWGTTWLLYRNVIVALLPLTVVGLSLLAVFGIMGLLGWRVNFLISALTLAIVVVGVANSIHVLSAWYEQQAQGKSPAEALLIAVHEMIPPCFMTSFSTCVGFLSLTVTNIQPIRQFGILAAIGTAAAFLLSMVYLPGIMCHLKPPHPSFFERRASGNVAQLLEWLGRPTRRRSLVVVATSVLCLGLAVWGITKIKTTANPLNYFRRGEVVRSDAEAVDRLFRSSSSVEFIVDAPKAGLSRREVLQRIGDFQTWMSENIAVADSMSIVDYLKEADRVRNDRRVGIIPRERLYTVLLRMKRIAPEIFYKWSDEAFSIGRISARLPLSKADQLAAQVPLINAELARRFSSDELRLTSTGYVKLVNNMQIYLLRSQVKSLLLAAVGITIMMCWMLHSMRLGLLSMIPNLLPVAIGISVMGFAGILLDPGTVMIGSVALGLVVDDTCHFLAYLQRQQLAGQSTSEAILAAMRCTGRPIVLTSIILSAGFMALAAGSFAPSIYFGVVISVIVVFALLADLLLLPAVLQLSATRRGAQ